MRQRVMILMVSMMLGLVCYGQDGSTLQSQINSQKYSLFFMEAMVQRQKGNNDAAFDLLRHCQQLTPEAPEVYFFLGQYYRAMRQYDKMMDCVKRAAELDPDNDTYMETLAQAYINNQDYEQAVAVAERIYERDKNREDMLEMLIVMYEQMEDYDNAIRVLNLLEQIDGKNERLSMEKSSIYMKMGDNKAAIAEREALARQFPNDLNYLASYGEALMMDDQKKKALEVYHDVLRQEPDNNRVLLSLRTYYQAENQQQMVDSLTERVLTNRNSTLQDKVNLLRQEIQASENTHGDSTRVIGLFRKVMERPEAEPELGVLFVQYMELKKMPNDSISPVLEQILTRQPDYAAARIQLVGYAWEADDMDRVISLCQEARQYSPEEMAFYYYQGIAYYKRDSLDQALSAFQNGIGVINGDSNPHIVADFYAVMGDILHQKGKVKEAFEAYDSCLKWQDDNIGCLNNYAYYLSELGEQLSRAEEMSYKTIKAEPHNATYLDTYAWILYMQGRYAEAKIYIDQALQNMDETQSNDVIKEHAEKINQKYQKEKRISIRIITMKFV